MAAVLFWVCLLLMLVGVGFQGSWKGGPYAAWGLAFIAFVLLGIKVFGFNL